MSVDEGDSCAEDWDSLEIDESGDPLVEDDHGKRQVEYILV
jgi:hypothetical protein